MARPFGKLRALLAENDMTQEELARVMNLGRNAISDRMRGVVEWNLQEIWFVLRYFQIPANKMHEYFPENGQNEPGAAHRKPVRGQMTA